MPAKSAAAPKLQRPGNESSSAKVNPDHRLVHDEEVADCSPPFARKHSLPDGSFVNRHVRSGMSVHAPLDAVISLLPGGFDNPGPQGMP